MPPARLGYALEAARAGGADLVLLDTAPHAESDALAAMQAADLVLIPCRPSLLDLNAIGRTADIVRLTGKRAFVVFNAVPPGAFRVIEEASAAAAVHKLTVASAVMSQRAAFVHAMTAGRGVQEFEPAGAAALEIGRLYGWLAATLAGDRK